jgi:DNA-binding LacI/PurR family transcriptional regulator
MRLATTAAAAAFAQEQALILLPPAIVQTGLRGLAVDGGIVVDPSPLDPRVTLLASQGLPVVTIERDLGRPDDPWYVASETDANTRRVLNHLTARGARRIALLMPQTDWGWAAETLAAYDAWTREHGAPRLVVPVMMQSGEENAYRAARQLLDESQPPDAVFVVAARFVRGVLRAAKEVGCQVPGRLLIAGGVDSVHAREGDPPVTALDLHPDRQAEMAVEMLLARLDDGEVEAPRHIPATLRVRASTGGGSDTDGG